MREGDLRPLPNLRPLHNLRPFPNLRSSNVVAVDDGWPVGRQRHRTWFDNSQATADSFGEA